jgi:hypothetical protein
VVWVPLLGTAALLSGCSVTDGLMSSVELPAHAPPQSAPAAPSGTLVVTGRERDYLGALAVAGVHPSSDLLALSIGSYVCQARDAGQSPGAVWDFVHPLVSTDVHNAHLTSTAPTQGDIDATTNSYIQIATQRLC